jgi:SAM-dependent methyltransferase
MITFGSPQASHAHSLAVLETLYQFDDFMQSIENVIDMGCGAGLDMLWWVTRTTRDPQPRPLNIKCMGIDLAESCAATAKHKYVSYAAQDFEQLVKVHKRRFDVIWCHDAFQFVQDPFRTLKQWRDIAAPGAMLALVVPQTTNFSLNREQCEQASGCYWHWTLVNLLHVLAVSGWNCASGFFQKLAGDPWITAIVYRGSYVAADPRKVTWYELCDSGMLPDSVVSSVQRHGYLRQQDLTLPWIDKSLTWFGRH